MLVMTGACAASGSVHGVYTKVRSLQRDKGSEGPRPPGAQGGTAADSPQTACFCCRRTKTNDQEGVIENLLLGNNPNRGTSALHSVTARGHGDDMLHVTIAI
jgi:hypothetical protein